MLRRILKSKVLVKPLLQPVGLSGRPSVVFIPWNNFATAVASTPTAPARLSVSHVKNILMYRHFPIMADLEKASKENDPAYKDMPKLQSGLVLKVIKQDTTDDTVLSVATHRVPPSYSVRDLGHLLGSIVDPSIRKPSSTEPTPKVPLPVVHEAKMMGSTVPLTSPISAIFDKQGVYVTFPAQPGERVGINAGAKITMNPKHERTVALVLPLVGVLFMAMLLLYITTMQSGAGREQAGELTKVRQLLSDDRKKQMEAASSAASVNAAGSALSTSSDASSSSPSGSASTSSSSNTSKSS